MFLESLRANPFWGEEEGEEATTAFSDNKIKRRRSYPGHQLTLPVEKALMDSEYLKSTVGPALTLAMSSLVVEQPNDSVEVSFEVVSCGWELRP